MSLKHLTCPSKILASSITASASSFQLNNIEGWDGVDLTSADFGSQAFAVIRNANNTILELIEFDPTTIASASITITRRGLKFTGDLTTEVTANKLAWTKGDTYIDIGVDTPQMYQWLQEYVDAAIVAGGVPATTSVLGLVKMTTAPANPAIPLAVGDNDPRVPTTTQIAAMAGDTTPSAVNSFITKGKSLTAGATINGATLPVPVYQNKTDNEFYACDANDTAAMKFLGFAISNGTDGAAMNVQFTGIVSGFTALDEGEKYYVQDAVGTIGTSPGTYEVLVGVAISQTELLIMRGKRRLAGNTGSLGTASGSSVVTSGFRPSVIRLHARLVQTGDISMLDVVWINGVIKAVNGALGVQAADSLIILYDSGGIFMTLSISSVTDTGFTIVWTETGAFSVTASEILWEAEGEL